MKFNTMYDEHEPVYTNPGSCYANEYIFDYDENGCECLTCVGKRDIYQEIQSHREGCDLATALSRLDPQQVNSMISSYTFEDICNNEIIDCTKLPRNGGDMFNLMKKGEQLFNGLPEEIRKLFNYSSKKFISEFGSKDFADKIKALNDELFPPQDPEIPMVQIVNPETLNPTKESDK